MEILNKDIQQEQVGGDWACLMGCGAFCLVGGGTAAFVAAFSTVL